MRLTLSLWDEELRSVEGIGGLWGLLILNLRRCCASRSFEEHWRDLDGRVGKALVERVVDLLVWVDRRKLLVLVRPGMNVVRDVRRLRRNLVFGRSQVILTEVLRDYLHFY